MVNFGIVNLMIAEKFRQNYFKGTLLNESKDIKLNDFLGVLKSSPILMLEYKVFNNLENKHIEDTQLASKYIDDNINLFETYTNKEIEKEREKLKPFVNENFDKESRKERIKLYESINNLINETLKPHTKTDVDLIHESFTKVLNHITTKPSDRSQNFINENINQEREINDDIIEIAVGKFNEKYNQLDEDEKKLIKELIYNSEKKKVKLFEKYKTDCLDILEHIDKNNDSYLYSRKNDIVEKINNLSEEIDKTHNKNKKLNENIIKLFELHNGLCG